MEIEMAPSQWKLQCYRSVFAMFILKDGRKNFWNDDLGGSVLKRDYAATSSVAKKERGSSQQMMLFV